MHDQYVETVLVKHGMQLLLQRAWRVINLNRLHRKRRVFLIMLSGCRLNCLPAFLSRRLAAVVAAYSAALRLLIAASGK